MASNQTPNLKLNAWEDDDYVELAEINENFLTLDSKITEKANEEDIPVLMSDVALDSDSIFSMQQNSYINSSTSKIIKVVTADTVNASSVTNVFAPATGTSFEFIAPQSGKVAITIQCGYVMPTTASSLEVCLLDISNAVVPKTIRRMARVNDSVAGEQGIFTYKVIVEGLTAGIAVKYSLGIRRGDGTGSVGIRADTSTIWGQFVAEVQSIPSEPISATNTSVRMTTTKLSKWLTAKQRVIDGTGSAKILVIGDSTVFGGYGMSENWPYKLSQRLANDLTTQFGGMTPGLNPGANPRYTAGTGWPSGRNYGFGSQGWQYNNPSGTLDYADPNVNSDSFDVYYVRGSGSTSITLQIDNETAQTSTTTGVVGIGKLTVSSATPSTSHKLKISAVGTGAILFIEPTLSTGKYLRVANAGVPSTNSLTWASGVGIYSRAAMIAYQPDLVIMLLGANDAIGGYTSTQFLENVSALKASIASTSDFIVVSSVPCQILSEAALQKQYAAKIRYMSDAPFIDLNKVAGDWETWNGLGYMTDLRHPNEAGMQAMANLVYNSLSNIVTG
jgi:lysophospholipase L1-like esterase